MLQSADEAPRSLLSVVVWKQGAAESLNSGFLLSNKVPGYSGLWCWLFMVYW